MRWIYNGVFVLLVAHFAYVYVVPDRSLLSDVNIVYWLAFDHELDRSVLQEDYVITGGDRMLLRGGDDVSLHFDLMDGALEPERISRHGAMRGPASPDERDSAVMVSADEADRWLPNGERVMVVHKADEVRAYPIPLLERQPVINDRIGEEPILVVHGSIADFTGVFRRKVGGEELQFALTGYMYFDPEVAQGYRIPLLWDVATRSLWWPPHRQAGTGPLQGKPLEPYAESFESTWRQAKQEHPHINVLGRDRLR